MLGVHLVCKTLLSWPVESGQGPSGQVMEGAVVLNLMPMIVCTDVRTEVRKDVPKYRRP